MEGLSGGRAEAQQRCRRERFTYSHARMICWEISDVVEMTCEQGCSRVVGCWSYVEPSMGKLRDGTCDEVGNVEDTGLYEDGDVMCMKWKTKGGPQGARMLFLSLLWMLILVVYCSSDCVSLTCSSTMEPNRNAKAYVIWGTSTYCTSRRITGKEGSLSRRTIRVSRRDKVVVR